VLAIVAGGVIGASFTFGALVSRPPADDVLPQPVRVVDGVTVQGTITEQQLRILREIYIERVSILEEQLSSVRREAEDMVDSDIPDRGRERAYELTERLEREIGERLRAQLLQAERLGLDISVELTATELGRRYRELWPAPLQEARPAPTPIEVGLLRR
jgi:hypothetical protein